MVTQIKLLNSGNIDKELIRPDVVTDHEVVEVVRAVIEDVTVRGDRALIEYTAKFDRVELREEELSVSVTERDSARDKVPEKIIQSLKLAADRIRKYHQNQLPKSWTIKEEGAMMGQIARPIGRVGLYVPGGLANYPSSVLMNAIPAQIAGVPEMILCVPPAGNGKVSKYTLAAASILGIDKIYKVGGAQAIAAMAFGTDIIKRVDKIAGPGNIYVATAKKLVVGTVDIDMIAGPTEIVIIADKQAKVPFIAADMIAQAEHDSQATSILITDSSPLAEQVNEALEGQLGSAARLDIARSALNERGRIYVVDDLRVAFEFVNRFAPEHLEIMTVNAHECLSEVKNAGAIFLGNYSPEALGDYIAGSNHVLPTGSTARFYSPLGVYDFVKWSSFLSFSKEAMARISADAMLLSDIEGLEGHGRSIKIRLAQDEDQGPNGG